MSSTGRQILLACCLCALGVAAGAQEPPVAPADTTWHSREPPAAAAKPEAPAEEAPAQEGAPAEEAAPADGAAEESAPTEAQPPDEDGDFIPTEKIRADSALSFPSDI